MELHSGLVGSQLIAITDGQTLQRVSHPADHTVPVAQAGLAKLTQRRIPRAVVAIEQPSPTGIEAIQKPDRLAESAGKMHYRRIDADHQIQSLDQCRGVGEVGEFISPIMDEQTRTAATGSATPLGLSAMTRSSLPEPRRVLRNV